jgi:hypothetical protein
MKLDTLEILESETENADASKLILPPIKNAAQLLADKEIKMPPEIIEGVLHQGLKCTIGGSSKSRKTWIVLDMGLSVSTGKPFWKWNTKKGRVLYINFEIPEPFIKSRLECLAAAKGIKDLSGLDVWTLRGHAAPLGSLLPELLLTIQTGTYALIIIDPIYKGLGGRDENSAGDISELCNELEQLAVKTGAAVVFAAHFSKGNQAAKEAMDRIGGSGVFSRDADSLLILTKHDEENAFTVDLILRNLPEHPSFVVEWDFPLMREASHLDPLKLKQAGGRGKEHDHCELLAVIADTTPENPISVSAWAIAAKVHRTTLNGYLTGMRRQGLIATVGEGSSARQHITNKGKLALKDGKNG